MVRMTRAPIEQYWVKPRAARALHIMTDAVADIPALRRWNTELLRGELKDLWVRFSVSYIPRYDNRIEVLTKATRDERCLKRRWPVRDHRQRNVATCERGEDGLGIVEDPPTVSFPDVDVEVAIPLALEGMVRSPAAQRARVTTRNAT